MILTSKLVRLHHFLNSIYLVLRQSQKLKTYVVEVWIYIWLTVDHTGCHVQLGGTKQVHIREVKTNGEDIVNSLGLFTDDHRTQLA